MLIQGRKLISVSGRKIQTSFRRFGERFEDRIYITVLEPCKNKVKPNSISVGLDYLQAEQLSQELAQWAHAYRMQKLLADQ